MSTVPNFGGWDGFSKFTVHLPRSQLERLARQFALAKLHPSVPGADSALDITTVECLHSFLVAYCDWFVHAHQRTFAASTAMTPLGQLNNRVQSMARDAIPGFHACFTHTQHWSSVCRVCWNGVEFWGPTLRDEPVKAQRQFNDNSVLQFVHGVEDTRLRKFYPADWDNECARWVPRPIASARLG